MSPLLHTDADATVFSRSGNGPCRVRRPEPSRRTDGRTDSARDRERAIGEARARSIFSPFHTDLLEPESFDTEEACANSEHPPGRLLPPNGMQNNHAPGAVIAAPKIPWRARTRNSKPVRHLLEGILQRESFDERNRPSRRIYTSRASVEVSVR